MVIMDAWASFMDSAGHGGGASYLANMPHTDTRVVDAFVGCNILEMCPWARISLQWSIKVSYFPFVLHSAINDKGIYSFSIAGRP